VFLIGKVLVVGSNPSYAFLIKINLILFLWFIYTSFK